MAKRLQRKAERGTDSGAEHDETIGTAQESSPQEPQGESGNQESV